MKLTGSQLVAEILLEHGVDTVFGYPGGTALNLYDTLYEYRDKIRHILTAHEQGAAHAADGYSRATGKTGVVFATSGPGATNPVSYTHLDVYKRQVSPFFKRASAPCCHRIGATSDLVPKSLSCLHRNAL